MRKKTVFQSFDFFFFVQRSSWYCFVIWQSISLLSTKNFLNDNTNIWTPTKFFSWNTTLAAHLEILKIVSEKKFSSMENFIYLANFCRYFAHLFHHSFKHPIITEALEFSKETALKHSKLKNWQKFQPNFIWGKHR